MARGVVVAVALLALTGRAHAADEKRVAVLEIAIEGDAPPELRAQLEKSLDGGLYAAGFEVVTHAEVTKKLKTAPELAGCTSTTCLDRLGKLLHVTRFVRARVEASGAAYQFELELLGAEVAGGVVNRVDRSCSVCTIAEANDEMSRAATALPEITTPMVLVALRSDPPGAALEVDGKSFGVTPQEVQLPPGDHVVRATLDGRTPAEQKVTVVAGTPQTVNITLVASKPIRRGGGGGGARFGVWKWVAGGGGAALLGAGIVLIAIDGNGTGCMTGQPCKELYDTLPGGIALAVAGLAAGGVSAWMFVKDAHPQHEATVGVVPARGGGAVVLGWTF